MATAVLQEQFLCDINDLIIFSEFNLSKELLNNYRNIFNSVLVVRKNIVVVTNSFLNEIEMAIVLFKSRRIFKNRYGRIFFKSRKIL